MVKFAKLLIYKKMCTSLKKTDFHQINCALILLFSKRQNNHTQT